jgi:hypothetical protein
MAFTHILSRSFADTSKVTISDVDTITDDTELNFDGTVASGGSNVQIHWAATVANLKSVAIYSDQAITIYTNDVSGGSPQDTIAVKAGQVIVWTLATEGSGKIPFAGNVTTIYVTNPGGTIANVKIRAIAHQHS